MRAIFYEAFLNIGGNSAVREAGDAAGDELHAYLDGLIAVRKSELAGGQATADDLVSRLLRMQGARRTPQRRGRPTNDQRGHRRTDRYHVEGARPRRRAVDKACCGPPAGGSGGEGRRCRDRRALRLRSAPVQPHQPRSPWPVVGRHARRRHEVGAPHSRQDGLPRDRFRDVRSSDPSRRPGRSTPTARSARYLHFRSGLPPASVGISRHPDSRIVAAVITPVVCTSPARLGGRSPVALFRPVRGRVRPVVQREVHREPVGMSQSRVKQSAFTIFTGHWRRRALEPGRAPSRVNGQRIPVGIAAPVPELARPAFASLSVIAPMRLLVSVFEGNVDGSPEISAPIPCSSRVLIPASTTSRRDIRRRKA